jgi:hypothetical protein
MILVKFLTYGSSHFSLCNRHFNHNVNRQFLITLSNFQLITIYQKLTNRSFLSEALAKPSNMMKGFIWEFRTVGSHGTRIVT